MAELIQPRVLKGFRDILPAHEIERALLIEKLTGTFRSFGFVPIDTPALEYTEILLRKSDGETEKQVFRFEDNGGRDVALRFDLTVPFARFVAEHKEELYFPFKRYHIAKVWRGEKPQAGRYREFVQCDFDIVGSDSAAVDFEILNLMKTALSAIGVNDVTIRLSHRGIFNRFLASRGLAEQSEEILRTVDKLSKVGEEEVRNTLTELAGADAARDILVYIRGAGGTSADFDATLDLLERLAGGPAEDTKRLRDIHAFMIETGIAPAFVLDPSITRGLDYYTGVVYETFLNELPSIGSVCSGGRYDNLAGMYMKDRVTGVGSSIGLDRLLAGVEQLGRQTTRGSFTDAVVFCQTEGEMALYQKLAAALRAAGVACEVFPDPKKMNQQYAWAEKKSIRWGITASPSATGGSAAGYTVNLKDLTTRESFEGLTLKDAADRILKA
jgi:histidyl-tRNA synthetase